MKTDSEAYLAKKARLESILTVYGRKVVLEALQNDNIEIYKLHLSRSVKPTDIIDKINALAKSRGVEIVLHDKQALSRISKNAKQDQGVALDLVLPFAGRLENFISGNESFRIIALDGVTNPQNLGMIIRSCAAGNIDAVLLPNRGVAQISPLVIKASAGTLFKIPLLRTESLVDALQDLGVKGVSLYTLETGSVNSYRDEQYAKCSVFVLGNESEGVSTDVRRVCNKSVSIPMKRGVESLNVAVAASLLAFMD